MSDILGIELGLPARFLIAFVLVLALIGLTAWLIRQFGSARASTSGGARNRQPRLAVLDSAVVDARRRLVLIRRDNVEHLILIGGPTDVVVEANVVRAQSAAAPTVQRPAPQRAPIEPIEPDYDPSLVPFDEPEFEEPVRSAPVRQIQPPAPARRETPPPTVPVRPAAATPRAAPARTEAQYDDMTHRLEAALRQPTAEIPTPRSRPEPRIPSTPAPAMRATNEPRVMAPTPTLPVQTSAAPPAKPAAPETKSGADVFASLEEEMASLLKPDGKTPS